LVDLFEEVDESLRGDQAADLVRRVAPWATGVLALILAVYLGYWAFTAWQQGNEAKASLAYQKGADALTAGDEAGALKNFKAAETAGAPGYRMLALLQEGDLKLAGGDGPGAAKLYDAAAAAAPNAVFGDLSRLKAANALMDSASFAQLKTRLAPLADPKRPFAPYAKETLAMAEFAAGKTADAKKDCDSLQLNIAATDDMRQRCQVIGAIVDRGEGQIAVSAAKLSATIPPIAPLTLTPPVAGAGNPGKAPSSSAGAAK
jgi:hypothetical protein